MGDAVIYKSIALAALLALAACGAPAGLDRAITTLAQSSTTVENALADIDAGSAQRITAANKQNALQSKERTLQPEIKNFYFHSFKDRLHNIIGQALSEQDSHSTVR